jgi:hypothetical protein
MHGPRASAVPSARLRNDLAREGLGDVLSIAALLARLYGNASTNDDISWSHLG